MSGINSALFTDVRTENGEVSLDRVPGQVFVVTGTKPSGKRFKPIRTGNWLHAIGINVYRGTLWVERKGKRKALITYYN